jgi:hypothetical protein
VLSSSQTCQLMLAVFGTEMQSRVVHGPSRTFGMHWPQRAYTSSLAVNEAQPSNAMATIHNRIMRPSLASSRTTESVLAFLVPSAQCMRRAAAARFSTSPVRCKKDNNTNRGVSAVRGTGLRPRQTLSVLGKKDASNTLPKPVPIEEKVTGTPDHGLWDFFKDQKLLQTPVDEQKHGT